VFYVLIKSAFVEGNNLYLSKCTVEQQLKAYLLLSGYVYRENYGNLAAKTAHELHQNPPHRDKVNPLYRSISFGALGPFFFENDESAAVTVTSWRYLEMSGNVCEPELRLPGTDRSSVWSHQNGTTAQIARRSVNALRAIFP
jgi:hypothetical protein